MRTIKKLDVWSFVVYGAVLVAFWTLAFGIFYWITGWIFGAQSWFIDMNLVNWSGYTIRSIFGVIVAMFINGIGGAFAGLIVALVYNAVAGIMGGIKIELE
jgi:hypothetical protein